MRFSILLVLSFCTAGVTTVNGARYVKSPVMQRQLACGGIENPCTDLSDPPGHANCPGMKNPCSGVAYPPGHPNCAVYSKCKRGIKGQRNPSP
uniref:AlNc14C2288G13205 protein n=1 Tax=Albugo laibachii Nc14 TaxID=890382 RepID=F0X2X5_9STRA|nr:AlNc14C2288G13205 [Albugo laibachii Nc14]|eukprot:CCA28329.1 AlNc14C2288G13205 [Albugo laibachii Nc14]